MPRGVRQMPHLAGKSANPVSTALHR
jgi:hypothetical protein